MNPPTLYHGGVRRLHVGGVVLPPTKSGVRWSNADYGAGGVCRRDRVYVITELDQAELYACMAPPRGRGDVYEVEPIGDLQIDPDYSGPGGSFAVPMARVVRVVRRSVATFQGLTPAELAAVLSPDGDRYTTGERLLALRGAA